MRLPNTDPTIEVSTSSGTLTVTVHPARSWLVVVLELGTFAVFAYFGYKSWPSLSQSFRAVFALAILSGTVGLLFQWSGVEVIEINADKITLSNSVHGWERKREYETKNCRELEWMESGEHRSDRLQFKTGRRTISFGQDLTEGQANQILAALQQTLPNVAQQLCSYPAGKKHFLTLGLS